MSGMTRLAGARSMEGLGVTLLPRPRLPSVAYGQGLPNVPIGFAPVYDPAAVLSVDLHVHRTVRSTSVLDATGEKSCNDAFKLSLAHTEAIVLNRKRTFGLVEVERQSIVHIHRAERAYTGLCPGNAKYRGQQFCCGPSVSSGNYRVVQLNAHKGLRFRVQSAGQRMTLNALSLAAKPRGGSIRCSAWLGYFLLTCSGRRDRLS